MNKRQTKKALNRMVGNPNNVTLWRFYLGKKLSKNFIKRWRMSIAQKNKENEEAGNPVRYAPYIMCTVLPTLGNYSKRGKIISSRYATTTVDPDFYII